ncbi:MAG: PP2C family protein-serine/threonine phosphatase [Bacteroidota bacterium]
MEGFRPLEELTARIDRAIAREDLKAERFANGTRLALLGALTCVALVNVASVSIEANAMNFGALAIGFAYGITVSILLGRSRFFPAMKYVTSCLDVVLLTALLFLYTRIEIPSVALKNTVFLVVFPLIGLTAFRYDRRLTLVSGGLAVLLYAGLVLFLALTGAVRFTPGGYERELFSAEVTYVGQGTKVLILAGFVVLLSYLARYSRGLFVTLVSHESSLQGQKEAMERELEIAAHVQAQLQPRSFPDIRGLDIHGAVEQGRFVGGDYCDFIKVSDDTLLLVMADVSGKGVPAALVMSEVRATVHLIAHMKLDPAEVVARLNTLLHQSTRKKDFVTFVIAEIDIPHGEIRYVNAGHPPPMLFVEGEIRSLGQRTVPLGLFEVLPELAAHREAFPPGALLLCCTDGITERTNTSGEEYGPERLTAFLRNHGGLGAHAFVRRLLEEVRSFGEGRGLEDDVGVAVARRAKAGAA